MSEPFKDDEELLERARDYVRRNRSSFTERALRERMIQDGVPPDVADRAISDVGPSPYSDPTPESVAADDADRRRRRWVFVGVAFVSVIANILVVLVAAMVSQMSQNSGVFFAVVAVGVVAECMASGLYASRTPGMTAGLVVAIALTPVAVAALLVGGCIAVIVIGLSSGHH